jgi:ferrous iron transport protein B
MGVGIISGVGAKEIVVSTLGVMYSGYEIEAAGSGVDASATSAAGHVSLSDALKHAVTPAGALAYMVFILLYFPCVATFIAIRNETGSWKWALLTAVYTIVLAWLAAFATFHLAGLFF